MGRNAMGGYHGGNQWGAMPWWGSAMGGCHGDQYHGGLDLSIFVRKAACSALCSAPHLGKGDVGNQDHNKPCYWVPACIPCVSMVAFKGFGWLPLGDLCVGEESCGWCEIGTELVLTGLKVHLPRPTPSLTSPGWKRVLHLPRVSPRPLPGLPEVGLLYLCPR